MNVLWQIGYNVLFVVGFLLSWPYFTYRLRKRGHLWRDFGTRLGLFGKKLRRKLAPGVDLWIHAVSVGEVMLASVLLRQMREENPGLRVVISTTTQTGQRLAKKLEDERTTVIYNPTDFYWGVRHAFHVIRPKVLVLVEAEIWPNYIWQARRRNIPICILNTRLSPRTEARYRKLRWFCRPVLRLVNLVFAQHPSDIERLVAAGFAPEAIFPVGSLKYEVADLPEGDGTSVDAWWSRLGWGPENLIFLGGSTHNGEEEILARIYRELKPEFPHLRLVLAPRHAERGGQVADICQSLGLNWARRSAVAEETMPVNSPDVLILDSTGELRAAYRKADIVFIGKSLRSKGGQNFIEAARVGVPVLVGPNMQNFAHLTVEFLTRDGIVQVLDEFELAQRLRELLSSAARRQELGRQAQEIFSSNLGAGRTSARIIAGCLAHSRA
ncbi:MAG: glycosyltransferase N-terminal domain-containing protein [Verrucomicrobium sp.]|nr:glycosyltransferase N-terminal domain-containing protein [Verrucomicrobium sp.]